MLYAITMSSGGGTTYNYMSGLSWKDANEICDNMNWEFCDENCFVWSLDIEEDCYFIM